MKKLLGLLLFLALFSMTSIAELDESTQLKLGLGYPELYTYELEHRIGAANSLYASYSGIKYLKSGEEISIYGFNLGWREYLGQDYGAFSGWYWGLGVLNRSVVITRDNILVTAVVEGIEVTETFDLDVRGKLWMVFWEMGNTFRFGNISLGTSVGLGYGQPDLHFKDKRTTDLLQFEIPNFWPVFRVHLGVLF